MGTDVLQLEAMPVNGLSERFRVAVPLAVESGVTIVSNCSGPELELSVISNLQTKDKLKTT
jgi:hypothetical protein